MKKNNRKLHPKIVGMLGYGEIGKSIARICREAGFTVLIRELKYDQLKGKKLDYLYINIPEINNRDFIKVVVKNIQETSPVLTIINSSTTPGTTRKIFQVTSSPIVHSPVIGVHPKLYESIKIYFPKIIGPADTLSLGLAKKHFKDLGLSTRVYNNSETSEAAKLLDLVYYAWNIIFCKWVEQVCKHMNLNFNQVYTLHNKIYNKGYRKILPNVVRPVLFPVKGSIGGHCTIEDTILFNKYYNNRFTKFILRENKNYSKEKFKNMKPNEKSN